MQAVLPEYYEYQKILCIMCNVIWKTEKQCHRQSCSLCRPKHNKYYIYDWSNKWDNLSPVAITKHSVYIALYIYMYMI